MRQLCIDLQLHNDQRPILHNIVKYISLAKNAAFFVSLSVCHIPHIPFVHSVFERDRQFTIRCSLASRIKCCTHPSVCPSVCPMPSIFSKSIENSKLMDN